MNKDLPGPSVPEPSGDAAPARKDSLIEYPSLFPIKVMGVKVDGLVHAITQVAHQFDPAFDASTIELRESSGGKYLGVTVTVTATTPCGDVPPTPVATKLNASGPK